MAAMRFFNTEGPVRPEKHYAIAPLSRVNLGEILMLIRREKYFVLHAPRQTGKTSALLALRDLLHSGVEGPFRCVYANFEVGQAGRERVGEAMRAILGQLAGRARRLGDGFPESIWRETLADAGPLGALGEVLTRWSEADPRPLVLLLDEIDALVGDTLVSVLRQLRAGYDQRPGGFPQSIVLCGVRDVRDYRIHAASEKEVITGGSAFNIKARSLRLGDFSEAEIRALLAQHTEETGEMFLPEALETVWNQTQGQPWLVNALADEVCREDGLGRGRPICAEDIFAAREELIRRRDTHLDQLADKLQEERVRRVIEPLLSGASVDESSGRDLEYVRDLGLIARSDPVRMANPIYAEVVPRELTWAIQAKLIQDTAWYITPDGGLDTHKLLAAFQEFFREHSEHWIERFQYSEAAPQLLLQAFCQRIVNSGGRVEREYGLGRGRTDLLLMWPRGGRWEKFVVECKILRKSREWTEREGLRQTAGYMDRCAAEAGHLVIFDRIAGRSWDERIYRRNESANGRTITIWGM